MKAKGALAILLLTAVIIFFIYFMKTEKKAPIEEDISRFNQTRAELTSANLESITRAILEYMADHDGQVPDSLQELLKLGASGLNLTDGWGRNIKYQKLSETGFELRSAGADGRFNTDDDIIKENK